MGKRKEYEFAIKLAGEIERSFYESMKLSKKELKDIAKQAAETTMRLEKITGNSAESAIKIKSSFSQNIKDAEPFFAGLESAAKTAFGGMTKAAALAGAGITTGLVSSIHVGSEFESAFAGVKKTVNASNAELTQMRDAIRELAKDDLPATAAELSAIAESAGQLGIHNGNIMGFTRTMADLDVSTDLGDGAADGSGACQQYGKFRGCSWKHYGNPRVQYCGHEHEDCSSRKPDRIVRSQYSGIFGGIVFGGT